MQMYITHASGDAAVVVAGEDDLGIGEVLAMPDAEPLGFRCQIKASIAHARACKAAQMSARKAAAAVAGLQVVEGNLEILLQVVPGAAQFVGMPHRVGRQLAKRKRGVTPEHYKVPVRAVHIPSKTKLKMGITHKKLICLGADLVERRQRRGITEFLKNIKWHLLQRVPETKFIHNVYVHMWDEVNTRLRPQKVGTTRVVKKWAHQQIIMQKGALVTMMKDLKDGHRERHCSVWLCRPRPVETLTSNELLRAVMDAFPKQYHFEDEVAISETARSATSSTIIMVPDGVSSNIAMLKQRAFTWETQIRPLYDNILFLGDTCGIHQHHRAKLTLKALKFHVCRHFSIANLNRLGSMHIQVIHGI